MFLVLLHSVESITNDNLMTDDVASSEREIVQNFLEGQDFLLFY